MADTTIPAEVNRLETAKSQLASAISAKGVTVPEAAKLDAYPDYVASIPGGGSDIGEGKYLCRVIDYDGTVLLEKRGNNGDTVTLPTPPTHDRLAFQGWSCSQAVVDNTVTFSDNNISVGAIYETASGKTEFDITLTRVTGLTVTFQNLTGMTEIDWGDKTTDSTLTHTYSDYGNYIIQVSGVTGLGSYIFNQSGSTENYYCTATRIGRSVTSIGGSAFSYCYSLISVVIPQSVVSIGSYAFNSCYSLTSVVIPQSVTSIRNYAFSSYSLTSVVIPQSVVSIGSSAFSYCYSLISVVIPQSVRSIGDYAFSSCYSLTSVVMPQNVRSIRSSAFRYNSKIVIYDFRNAISIPTLSNTNAFDSINDICVFIIPDTLYDEWISATNWSTYVDYMYKASEVTA